jgi:homoserine kinase
VTAKVLRDQPGKVVIESIVGDNGRLSLDPADNCIGIAATETLKLLGNPSCGVSLKLHKVSSARLSSRNQVNPRSSTSMYNSS